MPAAQSPQRVTLPSIEEMFPAELLGLPPQRGLRLPQPASPPRHHAVAHRLAEGRLRHPAGAAPSPAAPAGPRATGPPAVPARRASQPDEERRHACASCGKAFNRPSSLAIHVNTHTGAKPYACPFTGCGRSFNVNSNMRRHLRNHTSPARPLDPAAPYTHPLTTAPRAPYPRAPAVRRAGSASGEDEPGDDAPCARAADLAADVRRVRLRAHSAASSTASSPRSPPAAPAFEAYTGPAVLHPSNQVYRLHPAR